MTLVLGIMLSGAAGVVVWTLARRTAQNANVVAELEAIFRAQPDSMFVLDPGGVITSARAGRDETENLEVLVGTTLRNHLPEASRSDYDEVLLKVRDGSVAAVQYPAAVGWREFRIVAMRGGYLALARDVSDLKAKELDLARSNADLEQFAYAASHDLREPLRMVSGYVELLQRKHADKLNDEGRKFLGLAIDGARRMSSLIDGLLTYSRAAQEEPQLELVELERVVAEVLQDLSHAVSEASAEVRHDALPDVWADPVRLRQLIQNLVSNALKFSRPDVAPVVRIKAEMNADDHIISVADNGIGIPKEQRARVFQMFQRLHARDAYEGTGIGLALVRKIVEQHHGRIWIESKVGEGTTFFVALPRKQRRGSTLF